MKTTEVIFHVDARISISDKSIGYHQIQRVYAKSMRWGRLALTG